MLTVIAYDIVSDRRREAVSTLLEEHGLRVNYQSRVQYSIQTPPGGWVGVKHACLR